MNSEEIINQVAYAILRKYRGYVTHDDLYSEGVLWTLEHPKKFWEMVDHEEEKLGAWQFRRAIKSMMDGYARKEKAAISGYHPEDEEFYSVRLVSMILPSVYADDPAPPVGERSEVRKISDPAAGGDWIAMYLDVKYGFLHARFTGLELHVLDQIFSHHRTQQDIADDLGVTQAMVAKHKANAMRKIIAQIGGPRPERCPVDCEHNQPL